jgi:hypothetical protein
VCWAKLNDNEFKYYTIGKTNGWQWLIIDSSQLTAGTHALTIVYRNDSASFDKICVTNSTIAPVGIGKAADKACVFEKPKNPEPPVEVNLLGPKSSHGYALGQNYPNPFNKTTSIAFEIPADIYVSLKVYNVYGAEIAELAGKKYIKGKHTLEFDSKSFSNGIYFYTFKSAQFIASRKMTLQGE